MMTTTMWCDDDDDDDGSCDGDDDDDWLYILCAEYNIWKSKVVSPGNLLIAWLIWRRFEV